MKLWHKPISRSGTRSPAPSFYLPEHMDCHQRYQSTGSVE
jgi:hypothetical protein